MITFICRHKSTHIHSLLRRMLAALLMVFLTSSVKNSEGFLWGPLELEKLTVGSEFDRKILINSAKTNLFMVENGTINGQPWRTFLSI